MTDRMLARDIRAVAHLRGRFLLRSGRTASEYFDKYRFEGQPALLKRIADAMLAHLPPDAQLLAGLELGGVPIATAMSLQSGMPVVFVRKQAKDYGTCLAVEGGDIAGRSLVLVEDVITTGGAVVDAARLVRDAGGRIRAILCAIWRGEGDPHIPALPGVPVFAALTKADLLNA
ncbi:MAG: orotate phosphoribosyltransferase [Sphingobium sp.]